GAHLSSYKGASTDIVVPAAWKGQPVVEASLAPDDTTTSIDLGHATDLRILSVIGGDPTLDKLDVSRNTKLTRIVVADVPLTSLDVSVNTSLEELRLGFTRVKKLNLSRNTRLVSLYCGGYVSSVILPKTKTLKTVEFELASKLKTLNVRNNPGLTTLLLGDSGLSKIDLSKNKALQRLDLSFTKVNPASAKVSMLTKLTELSVGFNTTFSRLDLKKLTRLEVLDIAGTKLKTVGLKTLTKLRSLTLGGALTKVDLSRNTQLTWLHDTGKRLVSLNLSKNTKLETVAIYGSKLTSLNVRNNKVLRSLGVYNTPITRLDISGLSLLEGVDVWGGKKLAALTFGGNAALESVVVLGNKVTSLDVSTLGKLGYLDFSGNPGLAVRIDPSNNPDLYGVEYSPVTVSAHEWVDLGEGWKAQTLTNAK
ncbi:MAG TPA: hypothetical protein VGK17_02575, partial [Propionicimonas sp.]